MILKLTVILMLGLLPQSNPLEKFTWDNRILLFYGNEYVAAEYENFKEYIEEAEERDMVLIWTDGKNIETMPANVLSTNDAPQIVQNLGLDRYKTNITMLIGKDGTIKKKYNLVIPQYVFDLIDSMPMRQNEIRRKQLMEQSQLED